MSCPIFYSGFNGFATVGGQQIPLISWTVNPTVELVEFKNSLSGVAVMRQPTFQDVSGSIVLDYDFSNDPFQGTLNLVVGTVLTDVVLGLHAAVKGSPDITDPAFSFASIIINSTPVSTVVEGKVGVAINFMGAGLCTQASAGYATGGTNYPNQDS